MHSSRMRTARLLRCAALTLRTLVAWHLGLMNEYTMCSRSLKLKTTLQGAKSGDNLLLDRDSRSINSVSIGCTCFLQEFVSDGPELLRQTEVGCNTRSHNHPQSRHLQAKGRCKYKIRKEPSLEL